MATNEFTAEYGLILSREDAKILAEADKDEIAVTDRVEIGETAAVKLVKKFSRSSYIAPDDYAEVLAQLLEVFYEAKEESLDVLTDDEVIDVMFEFFEGESGGSIEVLRGRDMEVLCRSIRMRAMGVSED